MFSHYIIREKFRWYLGNSLLLSEVANIKLYLSKPEESLVQYYLVQLDSTH